MNKNIDDDYMNFIGKKCSTQLLSFMSNKKVQEKVNDYDLVIPTGENIDLLFKHNYNKEQLKLFVKHYKLRLTGNKKDLITRLFCYLTLSVYINKIQKIFRGHLQRKYNEFHGPAFKNRSICTNNMDFFTMDELSSLPYTHFFSYKDKDGFVYGFDIVSLHNLVKMNKKEFVSTTNPFNRNEIPNEIIAKMKHLLRLGRILKIPIKLEINDDSANISNEKTLELRTLSLFQSIDALGNYSMPEWFTSLNQSYLWRFLRELGDIWNYRAQISMETKRSICPPNGDPFRGISMSQLYHSNLEETQKVVLCVMEKIVNSGVNTDSRTLGSYYILGCLTLVNDNAAGALPWLYQSFAYM
jgi:hypothetical protein